MLDASVVVKWFTAGAERHLDAAHELLGEYLTGRIRVLVPGLIELEVLNVAARKWRWPAAELTTLAERLRELGLVRVELDLPRVVEWIARGLTAYDAAYVAVADAAGVELITDDRSIVEVAPGIARALAG